MKEEAIITPTLKALVGFINPNRSLGKVTYFLL